MLISILPDSLWESKTKNGCAAYKLIIDFYTPKDQPNAGRIDHVHPLLLVSGIDVDSVVAHEVYPRGLSVSHVGDVINVSCVR